MPDAADDAPAAAATLTGADRPDPPSSLRLTRGVLLAAALALALVGCLGGAVTAETVVLFSGRQPVLSAVASPTLTATTSSGGNMVTRTATVTATKRLPTPTRPANSGGSGPAPTYPPTTPQPPLYSVRLVSKVFGTNQPYVGMNLQIWPPDRNAYLQVTYSVCAAQGAQTSALFPSWSDYGIGEVDLDVGPCWDQPGATITLDVTAYWSTGQTSRLQTTAPINW